MANKAAGRMRLFITSAKCAQLALYMASSANGGDIIKAGMPFKAPSSMEL